MYAKGEWLVHSEYGVGLVEGIVKKDISGKLTRYIKIKASKSVFWLPQQEIDKLSIRPLSTPEQLQEAIASLQLEPQQMSSNYKERHQKIQKARSCNTLIAVAQMIRDLHAQGRNRGNLTTSENRAWRAMKQQFVEEWSILDKISNEQAEVKLTDLLKMGQE